MHLLIKVTFIEPIILFNINPHCFEVRAWIILINMYTYTCIICMCLYDAAQGDT